ncbi:MAG: hypothetical protein Q7S63_00655 [bacterium]|nr:hypothetical protein [bacterium]
MNIERIIGFLLLILGLGIIGFTLFNSFQIFMGKMDPPQVFSAEQKQQAAAPKSTALSAENLQQQAQQIIQDQIQNILPQGTIPRMLNLAAWSFLAGLLMLGGSQIAGLGIKLIGAGKSSPQQK